MMRKVMFQFVKGGFLSHKKASIMKQRTAFYKAGSLSLRVKGASGDVEQVDSKRDEFSIIQ